MGCGSGIVPVILAKAFPNLFIAGLDLDARSIAMACGHAADAGLSDRIEFLQSPIATLPREPQWDLISTFDVMHDLSDPLGAMQHIRAAWSDGGVCLMVEPKLADDLEESLDNPFARVFYGITCLHGVPQSLAQGGPGLGACWGERRASALARAAGFTRFERPDIGAASFIYCVGYGG